ncbi:MAG: hypothetical protein V3W41_11965 [Planctomycetota bacterium]
MTSTHSRPELASVNRLQLGALGLFLILTGFACQSGLDDRMREGRPEDHRRVGMESQRMIELEGTSRSAFKLELRRAFGGDNFPRLVEHPSRNAVLISASPSQFVIVDRVLQELRSRP